MRFLRIVLVLVFAALAAFYVMNENEKRVSDADEGPMLVCSEDVLNISVRDSRKALMKGISASDAQDGDLTGEIIISGVSKLMEGDHAKVTYVVVDSDNNIATVTRRIHYTDYQPPRFSLLKPLVYSSMQNVSIGDRIQVLDSIDGDITHNIRVTGTEATDDPAMYTLDVMVTNSMGDTAELRLPILLSSGEEMQPVIELGSYLVYLERGSGFFPESYIEQVRWGTEILPAESVTISGEVNTYTPGVYQVTYSVTHEEVAGMAILVVVVE
ncbi:MAG: DUF5011 domain-containing protein [Oscillospiraceae bacterium]|nr:DUF5011 domain-containing protein [Oscillospiraceae bacterium]